MPKISVLMPIYNTKETYLKEAIESILNQTYTDFEFLILNDSPENIYLDNIVQSYQDSRIKYYKNDSNIGITKSRNKLFSLACGEYIAVFDHDDISLPTRFEKEVKFLDDNRDIGVVSCNFKFMSSHIKTKYPESNLDIKLTLPERNCVLHTGMMIRKSIIDENNIRYEELYSPAEDYMLCLRLMEYTMFHNLSEVLVIYRDNYANTTNKNKTKMLDADWHCKCFAQRYIGLKKHKKCYWVWFFKYIPILKIKQSYNATKIYLFGLIPLVFIKKRKVG